MKELKTLLQIKKIIALLLTFVFCYLAIVQKIDPKDFMQVFLMVISFYYGQSTVRQAIKEQN